MSEEIKFVNLNYELKNERDEDHMIQCEIDEKKDVVTLKFATMCVNFEDKLKDMSEKIWINKQISIIYKTGIPLRFYTFRKFMERL